ncbi:MAG TPA: (2Fe-2S)-binding protein [Ideonella sp.]|jgi:aerobic-type carbon monoxide dehydrogenase small subunit (CoxS/CutS family)|nr:(2Fe-2S)-binding protein [Ideonella sp.]
MPTAPTRLVVNGTPRSVAGDPNEPLLWVLRDHLALTGTKYGCGIGACGACTVHVDGEPRRSCVTPVKSVAGRRVVTIEALAPSRSALHPVQQAWVEHDVPQCGWCQAGQMMAVAALLRAKPAPTDADIDDALRNHLCRCGTYARIHAAVHRAAEIAAAAPGGRS